MGAPVRSESETRLGEQRFVYRCEDLRDRLLKQAVHGRWDTEFPGPAVGFRNLHPPDGHGFVLPRPDLLLEVADVGGQPFLEFRHGHIIYARRTPVADDAFEGLSDVVIVEDLIDQVVVRDQIDVFHPAHAMRFLMYFRFRHTSIEEAVQCFLLSMHVVVSSVY